mgnify:CR=1 FL=1
MDGTQSNLRTKLAFMRATLGPDANLANCPIREVIQTISGR